LGLGSAAGGGVGLGTSLLYNKHLVSMVYKMGSPDCTYGLIL
jgi:hypothetical protein